MKTLNLSLDLSHIKDEQNPPDIKKTWEGFIVNGCRTAYNDINLKMSCKLFKILDKLEKATDSIELEDAEFDVIKDIQERAKFDPSANKVLYQINNRIEEAK